MKVLVVGDPHATPDELGDCQALVDYICEVAKREEVNTILLLGDLYHTHAVIRAEVMKFWRDAFAQMLEVVTDVTVLLGNHDMPGVEGSKAHALLAHVDQPGVRVIDMPQELFWQSTESICAVMPYMSSKEEFIKWAKCFDHSKVLFCHQSFLGFKYENGHPIEDGIDPAELPQKHIVSGHIHTPQDAGKLWYVGAPRWRTAADANISRAIWTLTLDEELGITDEKFHLTDHICSRILSYTDRQDDPLVNFQAGDRDRVVVDIVGDEAWIESRKGAFPGARIRTIRTDTATIKVRESEGIGKALQSYLEQHKPKYGTPVPTLRQMVKDRLHEL